MHWETYYSTTYIRKRKAITSAFSDQETIFNFTSLAKVTANNLLDWWITLKFFINLAIAIKLLLSPRSKNYRTRKLLYVFQEQPNGKCATLKELCLHVRTLYIAEKNTLSLKASTYIQNNKLLWKNFVELLYKLQ